MDTPYHQTQLTEDEIIDNFCHMVFEEFLIKRQLTQTLQSFREEWKRPQESTVLYSWYDIALKLRLPELLAQSKKDGTVLENLVLALARESSIRNRRPTEVTVSGLATMPKTTTLPTLVVNEPQTSTSLSTPKPPISTSSPFKKPEPHNESGTKSHRKETNKLTNKRSVDSFAVISNNNSKNRHSNENWIPEDIRMRSLQRELLTVKEIFADTKNLETSLQREMKRLAVSDLERAKAEEKLVATKKVPCGCCMQEFLYVNLPMKVSKKAIIDIRIKWTGKLNSATVFRETNVHELADELANLQTKNATKRAMRDTGSVGSVESQQSMMSVSEIDIMGSSVPRCYDTVGICIFCSQFFQSPEEYRPSYQAIVYEEKKTAYLENKRREREYWDPLKMLEKDREAYEAATQQPPDF